ncbi:hypothetical protein TVAG_378300 [Trichomonas vaginalis G3]|uniref:UDENN domain-containing protein n=1 Tax=Trichomonas vaginalis (strain ATCC PRA-98 / G3) TaxID=412133 RepID=A2DB21_TRIV3|nr:Rab guanyl-nucleotide exchange factor protein [Trichomonas vaginalis G3]EAY22351.1 hypothetical protein TVAG_378300 [Trichomonas vaginalis G3]KAI5518289.1 Rab guanyl-nucleotide exchange factor protein [Trichomonas vaginalis G3]|eukprot:XP_001583337.1 hypothetical protein [Trichomonas vaginalis G3]
MFNFFAANDPNYFDYVVRVTQDGNGGYNFDSIYQKSQKVADDLNKQLGNFCFPYKDTPLPASETQTYYFAFTDEKKQYSYCFVHSREENLVRSAFTLVSRYFHPSLFCEIVQSVASYYSKSKSDAESFLNNILHLQLIRRPYDWSFTIKAGLELQNFDHLSPENEIMKLQTFLYSRFAVNDILASIVATMLDARIIILSSNIELLGQTVFSILALLYPLRWQGTFIPLLPSVALTALEAPFGYLIGVHSIMASKLLEESVEKYFVMNVDCHYSVVIGMDDFPAEILDLIDIYSNKIREQIAKYKPIFPMMYIQVLVREFMIQIFSTAYGYPISSPNDLAAGFTRYKENLSEDFPAVISQTQFVDVFIHQCLQDDLEERGNLEEQRSQSMEIIKAFWPDQEVTVAKQEKRRRSNAKKIKSVDTSPAIKTFKTSKAKLVDIHPKASEAPHETRPRLLLNDDMNLFSNEMEKK